MKRVSAIIAALRNPEIIAAALGIAQAIGLAWASVVADGNGTQFTQALAFIRGAFLGFALAFGLILVSFAVPRIDPRHKRIYLTGWASFIGLLLISPAIIAPAIQYSIPAAVLSDDVARWVWAISIAAAPDLVAIGIAVNGKLLQVAQIETTTTTGAQPTATKNKPKVEQEQPDAIVKQPISDELLLVAMQNNKGASQAQLGTMFDPPVSGSAVGKRIRAMKGKV